MVDSNVPVTIIRGDTQTIKVKFTKDGEYVKPEGFSDEDILTFSMRRKGSNEVSLTSTTTLLDGVFNITHEQSKELSQGKYDYDIELKKEDMSNVKTIALGEIEVIKDVTI